MEPYLSSVDMMPTNGFLSVRSPIEPKKRAPPNPGDLPRSPREVSDVVMA
jgi:hypothetical protein